MSGFFLGVLTALLFSVRRIRQARHDAVTAVRGERRRIARELHDIVGHGLLVIAMHARRLPGMARQTSPIAGAIDDMARVTMRDVRELIGTLRDSDPGDARRAARPLSQAITELGARLPGGELAFTLENVGHEHHIPPELRNTVLRIVQEGITNAIKHGAGKPVRVVLSFGDELAVSVASGAVPAGCGVGGLRSPKGYGLIGLRERVAVHGGSFEGGHTAQGGFLLRACFPVPEPGQRPNEMEVECAKYAS
ncbi:sensor histidine kinase [Planomonospora venezuelensis]|uniref:histidine kinase n=1 Tax=Planomonospora venezuelensis TaxID=1999 RepID=A0A841D2L5_PLAVE|nr:histidine kinase [Planomonospora venezuelensis]MBB5962415.1 signal transduction histidine kinase [Planomonospora venezuelensis]